LAFTEPIQGLADLERRTLVFRADVRIIVPSASAGYGRVHVCATSIARPLVV
jgi:hypothetical protein